MRKLAIVLLGLSLTGCAGVGNFWTTATGASVPPTAIYIARNSFDAVEVTATNYITYCKVHPTTPGCSKSAIQQVIPAVRSGRVARNNLVQFEKQNPGVWGPSGLYNALITATNTLQQISAQYNMAGVPK